MRTFNETKTQELQQYDLNKGYLKPETLFIARREAQAEVAEVSHYETVAEYPNGGKDVRKIIDVAYKPAREAYDEYESIQVYVPYSAAELAAREIAQLKQNLNDTDYIALKYAEGQLSAQEYATTKSERQKWRDKINELEAKL